MKSRTQSAFTLIEMLVVISIIAVLAALAVPALSQALAKGQMTGTMNNSRQLFLAGQQMALDGSANADPNLAFPGDYTGAAGTSNAAITKLSEYLGRLLKNNYLQVGDLQKLLNAPGTTCSAAASTDASGNVTVTLTGSPALKVFLLHDADSANTIFAESANYTYNTTQLSGSPYGTKGFIVQRKGGDASIFKANSATATLATGGDATKFQGLVGKLTGDPDGGTPGTGGGAATLGTESNATVLTSN
jgi:prepilin-type N-terminal cleavage/methylation domain-containing protein